MPRLLIVVTGTGVYPGRSLRTGLWLSEVTHIYDRSGKQGCEVVVASPKGGECPVDPVSLKPIFRDRLSTACWENARFRDLLRHTEPLSEVAGELFDGIYLAGGHGSMFDFPDDGVLRRLIENHSEQNRKVCAICHGVCGLLNAKRPDGRYLIAGRRLTGFSWFEELLAQRRGVVPFNLEAALRERGAKYRKAAVPTIPEVVVDGNLITGQDPFSSRKMAETVLMQLDNR